MEANSGHCADDALAADRGGLDRLAVPHHDDHGDHPGEREIDLIDFIAGFGKNRASGELHGDEMWQQPLQLLVRERRHQFVAERSRIDGIHGRNPPGRSGPCPAGIDLASENRRRSVSGK